MSIIRMNQRVIVSYGGVNQVGVVTKRSTKHKRKVYDITLENGSKIPFVRKDEPMHSIYIDTELTDKFADKIETNLFAGGSGNIK